MKEAVFLSKSVSKLLTCTIEKLQFEAYLQQNQYLEGLVNGTVFRQGRIFFLLFITR